MWGGGGGEWKIDFFYNREFLLYFKSLRAPFEIIGFIMFRFVSYDSAKALLSFVFWELK